MFEHEIIGFFHCFRHFLLGEFPQQKNSIYPFLNLIDEANSLSLTLNFMMQVTNTCIYMNAHDHSPYLLFQCLSVGDSSNQANTNMSDNYFAQGVTNLNNQLQIFTSQHAYMPHTARVHPQLFERTTLIC